MQHSTVQTPPRSLAQRMAALEKANSIRSHRARVKRDLAAGRISFERVLNDPLCATMKAWDALIALPKIGRVKANRVLARVRMSPSKTLGGLTDRQRDELLEHLS
jgi:hypothetical protein